MAGQVAGQARRGVAVRRCRWYRGSSSSVGGFTHWVSRCTGRRLAGPETVEDGYTLGGGGTFRDRNLMVVQLGALIVRFAALTVRFGAG
eukprot:1353-Rhodomonas_salina.1